MAKNISEIPYTEIVERGMALARVPDNARGKFRGVVQDVYVREIPTKYDWKFLEAESSITTTGEYKSGNININTGSVAATFSSDVSLTSGFTGRRLKVYGNDVVYGVTFSNTTAATLAPSFQGVNNASAASYTIFQPVYALASDFDRFLTDGGIDKWISGKRETIREESNQEFAVKRSATPSIPEVLKFVGVDTAGNSLIELAPPPRDARNYSYTYIRKLFPMIETTAGSVTIAAGATSVTGDTNSRFNEATTGDWLRIDAFGTSQDSTWYPIIAIAHDSSLTLGRAFATSGVANALYTISRAPEMPARMHPAVLFGALRNILLDQADENAAFYNLKMAEVLSDGKRIYVSRPFSQEIHSVAEEYQYRR